MLISTRKNFIFIHVSKTAGSNIARALGPFATGAERHPVNRLLTFARIKETYLGPLTIRRFRRHCRARHARRFLPRPFFDGAFKFAFVRNPWDWLVSQYHFLLRKTTHHRHKRVRRMSGFEAFVEYEIARNKRFQHPFITDKEGRLLVDFVGRFENLHEDFGSICRHVGIDARLPSVSVSPNRDYRAYYGRDLRQRVARHFHRDIELFGYTFDPRPLPPMVNHASEVHPPGWAAEASRC